MHYVTTSDHTHLFCKDWQPTTVHAAGLTIVLLSGWPFSADSWEEFAFIAASAGHRVIAYDRRGFGRSSQPFSGYDYDNLADDLQAVLTTLRAKNIVLVGFSMGGGEVARFLRRYPNSGVIKAAFVASVVPFKLIVPNDPSGTAAAAYEKSRQAILADRPAFFAGFFERFFGTAEGGTSASEAALLRWAQTIAMQACLPAT